MSASISFLSEAELHGLVDGHIEAERRADLLRRAALSETDRERIEAWQEQAENIRTAFRGIDKEQVPAALDLKPPARLLSLPPVRLATVDTHALPIADPLATGPAAPKRRSRAGLAAASTILVIGIGLAGAWMIAGSSPVASTIATPDAASGTVEDILAQRTARVLDPTASTITTSRSVSTGAVAMPTTSIPDLTSIGFTLSGAEAQAVAPVSLVFQYRNKAAEQIVIGVARAPREWRKGSPEAAKGIVVWRVGGKAYAIGGTLQRDRLRAIATSLRDEAIEE